MPQIRSLQERRKGRRIVSTFQARSASYGSVRKILKVFNRNQHSHIDRKIDNAGISERVFLHGGVQLAQPQLEVDLLPLSYRDNREGMTKLDLGIRLPPKLILDAFAVVCLPS